MPVTAQEAQRRAETIAAAGTALTEVGRVLSAKNEKALRTALETLQSILTQIGAAEGAPAESAATAVEAALAQDDSFDAIRYAVQTALRKRAMADMLAQMADDGGAAMEDMYDCPTPWIRDIYPGVVVYQLADDLYQCDYTINPDESVTLGPPIEVEVAYVPAPDADDAALPTGSVTVPTEAAAAPTRTEGGRKFPKSDYAYTPSDHPSSWKLRLTATPGGDPDPRMVGAAAAALSAGGYRGQKVQLPADAVAGAKAKVRAAWKKANPDKDASEMPDSIKESEPGTLAAESTEVEVTSDLIDLVERAVRPNGTVPIKIIQPGWGSSGHYSAAMLERDGPKVFTRGLHMYLDHPTESEDVERPERSVKDLAAVLDTDARWETEGPAGPGLYADARPLNGFGEALDDLAPHIGVSIRSLGTVQDGQAEGRTGKLITSLVAAKSVDFVTHAGAGGAVMTLLESARGRRTAPTSGGTHVTGLSEEEARVLREAMAGQDNRIKELETVVARQNEALVLRDARDLITQVLAESEMPDLTRKRLSDDLIRRPAIKDGQLDRDAMTTQVREAVKAELTYLAQATGGTGQIKGMGSNGVVSPAWQAQAEQGLAGGLARLGLSEAAATTAARGR